jgi:hypothetical protein
MGIAGPWPFRLSTVQRYYPQAKGATLPHRQDAAACSIHERIIICWLDM